MATEKKKPERSVTVWQPFREVEDIGRRFEDYFGRSFFPAFWRRFSPEGWSPAIDVVEKDDKFVVKVELPGVKEEDVDVSVSGDMLTISGEKREESEEKKKGYYYSESSYGSFSRSVTVPSSVDTSKIAADFDKGVLEITLPKTPEVKAKKIKVAGKKKT
jgi:HSP20 family protein